VATQIKAESQGPLYAHLCERLGWAPDAVLQAELAAANTAELAKLDEQLQVSWLGLTDRSIVWSMTRTRRREPNRSIDEPTNQNELQVATEALGDMEVLDALIAREKYYARIGDKQTALQAADEVRHPTLLTDAATPCLACLRLHPCVC